MGLGDEDLASPTAVRQEVLLRDAGACRLCGSFQGDRGCRHHVVYRSQGGLDVASNLVTDGWLEVMLPENTGATALQLRRWRGRGTVVVT
jgi:hypothetical protein